MDEEYDRLKKKTTGASGVSLIIGAVSVSVTGTRLEYSERVHLHATRSW
jgi:hypothetical protein